MLEIIDQLEKRLPELAWRLEKIEAMHFSNLPSGLFRCAQNQDWPTATQVLHEIRYDLTRLRVLQNTQTIYYLVDALSRKINILLRLCQLYQKKSVKHSRPLFDLQQMATRQQWLVTLDEEKNRLTEQHQAIQKSLDKQIDSSEAKLVLQTELLEITQRLSAVQSQLDKL